VTNSASSSQWAVPGTGDTKHKIADRRGKHQSVGGGGRGGFRLRMAGAAREGLKIRGHPKHVRNVQSNNRREGRKPPTGEKKTRGANL